MDERKERDEPNKIFHHAHIIINQFRDHVHQKSHSSSWHLIEISASRISPLFLLLEELTYAAVSIFRVLPVPILFLRFIFISYHPPVQKVL